MELVQLDTAQLKQKILAEILIKLLIFLLLDENDESLVPLTQLLKLACAVLSWMLRCQQERRELIPHQFHTITVAHNNFEYHEHGVNNLLLDL